MPMFFTPIQAHSENGHTFQGDDIDEIAGNSI